LITVLATLRSHAAEDAIKARLDQRVDRDQRAGGRAGEVHSGRGDAARAVLAQATERQSTGRADEVPSEEVTQHEAVLAQATERQSTGHPWGICDHHDVARNAIEQSSLITVLATLRSHAAEDAIKEPVDRIDDRVGIVATSLLQPSRLDQRGPRRHASIRSRARVFPLRKHLITAHAGGFARNCCGAASKFVCEMRTFQPLPGTPANRVTSDLLT
jgi:hypothetical protein